MSPDTSEFPLYDLDYVLLHGIYTNLSFVDLFELSFTNDDVRDTLREASVPIRSINIAFDSSTPSIHLQSGRNEFLWSFGKPEEDGNIIGAGEYQIRPFKFKCKRTSIGYYTEHFDVEHGMLAVIRYIVSIFNCSEAVIKELSIGLGVIEDSRAVCEHFTKFKSIKRLSVHQNVDIERNKLNFAQNFDWIMDNLKIEEIYVGVELLEHKMVRTEEGNFEIRPFSMRLDKALKVNHLCLKHANWFTSQDLMELDTETAIIGKNQLTAEDLNAFMKQWLNSTSRKLSWLEVKLDSESPIDVAMITDGLDVEDSTYILKNTKCSCPYRRFDSSEPEPFEFPADCKQITRENGEIGTIAITTDTFFFHVKDTGPIVPSVVKEPVNVERNEDERRLIEQQIEMHEVQRIQMQLLERNADIELARGHGLDLPENAERREELENYRRHFWLELRNIDGRIAEMIPDAASQPFQLHKLNVVELDKIFEHLSLVDIFHLSLTSPEIREALSETSLSITGIKVSYQSTLPTIELISEKSSLLWTSGYPDSNLEYAGEIKIGRHSFKCMKSENGFHTDHFDIEQGFFSVLTYFTEIFKCRKTVILELFIDLSVVDDCRTICAQYSAFQNIERLSITQSNQDPDVATSFGLNFDWIMNNLKPKETYLGVEVMENVLTQRRGIFDIRPTPKRFEKIFDFDHICLLHSDWISNEDFLKLDVKTAILMNSTLTEPVLNTFIKNWLNSESDKLYWMEVIVVGRILDKNVILSGLEVQDDTYHLSNSKCSCPFRKFETSESIPFAFPEDSKQVTRADGSASATISIIGDTFFFHVKNDGPITTPVPPEQAAPQQQLEPINENEQFQNAMQEAARDMLMRVEVEEPALLEPRRRRLARQMRLLVRRLRNE